MKFFLFLTVVFVVTAYVSISPSILNATARNYNALGGDTQSFTWVMLWWFLRVVAVFEIANLIFHKLFSKKQKRSNAREWAITIVIVTVLISLGFIVM